MISLFADFILPPRCICGKKIVAENNTICSECYQDSGMVVSNICYKCGTPQEFDFGKDVLCGECISEEPLFDQSRFVFKYNQLTARIITRMKYGDKTGVIKKMADFMSSKIVGFEDAPDIITSIPVSNKKLFIRKFNQSALVANHIARKTGIKIDNHLLRRIKEVPPQASLKRSDRLKNMKGVFEINHKKLDVIKDKSIVLVDDVITTGATVNEATNILKKAGAKKVLVLTFAKTLKEQYV